ncbi:hypothetical protein GCM10022295_92030 [Streptomyces osmaniensis]|uniref:Uncharacterized protein n=1 Tax=Streptomyces osmaniensis TaxID=593134 RepID=A0ABP6Z245_9ACTN
MRDEGILRCRGEVGDRFACGVDLPKESQGLTSQCLFDARQLVEVVRAEDLLEPFDFRFDSVTRSASVLEQGTQLTAGEFGCRDRRGCRCQDDASTGGEPEPV